MQRRRGARPRRRRSRGLAVVLCREERPDPDASYTDDTRVNEGCIAAAGPRARTHAFWESARHDLGDSSRRSLVLSPRSERQREPLRAPDLASRRARRPLARTPISGKRRPQKHSVRSSGETTGMPLKRPHEIGPELTEQLPAS
jgi:hypothetical protein